mgnify:FL=1
MIKRLFALIVAVLVAAFFMGTTAHAQLVCAEKHPATDLFEEYGEKIVAKALTAPGHLLQIFANLASGTYTMVLVPHDAPHLFCAAGRGTKFFLLKKKTRN